MLGTLNIGGVFLLTNLGTEIISLPGIVIGSALGEVLLVNLIVGDNTITIPQLPNPPTMVLVTIPPTAPPASGATLIMGPGATPAFTMVVSSLKPLWAAFPTTSTSFVINASAIASVTVTFL